MKKQQWYKVTVKATITKTQDIQATSQEEAEQEAMDEFNPHSGEAEESYTQEVISTKKNQMKNLQQSTLTQLQEIFFDVCDTLNGESPKDIGYASKTEMFEEFRWKLEAIEEDLRSVFGDLEANPQ
jgi:hypothetical protein